MESKQSKSPNLLLGLDAVPGAEQTESSRCCAVRESRSEELEKLKKLEGENFRAIRCETKKNTSVMTQNT